MTDPEISEQAKEEPREKAADRDARPPFDTSDLDAIPQPTDEDPPYRQWWVVELGNR